jgi:hypothetical protein
MLRGLLQQRTNLEKKQVMPELNKFAEACKRIEADANYRDSISEAELLNLIVGDKNTCKFTSVVVIVRSDLKGPNDVSKLYEIKTAQWEHINSDFTISHTDMKPVVKPVSTVLLVDAEGKYFFYNYGDASHAKFNNPLTHLDISFYLQDMDSSVQQYKQVRSW